MTGRHAAPTPAPRRPVDAGGAVLGCQDLHKTYRRGREHVHALRGVTLTVHPGEVVALVGRSGSGKTTLLNCLLGWETPDSGTTTLTDQTSATGARARWEQVAVVPQRFGLLEEITLLDNVALPARLAGHPDPTTAATEMLTALGLGDLTDRAPGEVSLGQAQRTALARALVVRPAYLVADEPTGRLDDETTTHVLGVLRDLCATTGTGALIASHDTTTITHADRVLHINDGHL
ncbi:ABC transporter ATP-binding protein [uncultured Pseudokineococcus sp.]|uniref:ABC transporter ATP-binding protein n=1 Tax=uncultured Pseudokineococcus sp. TaxID=1642928 RepID=UPI002631BDD1|nr:ABC transporter ATP-binding protein [uncultured Pseudokineococcus sp.]